LIDGVEDDSVSFMLHQPTGVKLEEILPDEGMCVYCSCGRIVTLDRAEMRLKLSLGKDLQCSECRNKRISLEIDYLNGLFDGTIEEEY